MHRGYQHLRGVPQNRRTPSQNVIDELATIHVPEFRALGPANEKGIRSHIAKGPHGAVHAAGNVLFGNFEEFGGKGHGNDNE